jgi:hypothetical protein
MLQWSHDQYLQSWLICLFHAKFSQAVS